MTNGLSSGVNLNATASAFIPQRKLSSQPNEGQQAEERKLERVPEGLTGAADQFESLEDGNDNEEEEEPAGRDLDSMENQLKSLLGFNPRWWS